MGIFPTMGSLLSVVQSLSRRQKRIVTLCVDVFLIPVCLVIAVTLQQNGFSIRLFPADLLWQGPLLMLVAWGSSVALGIPDIKLNAYEASTFGKTGALAALVTMAGVSISSLEAAYLPAQPGQGLSPSVAVTFGLVFFVLSVLSRLVGLQVLLWIYSNQDHRTRILIYGAGATGVQLMAAIRRSEEIEPLAFVDDNKTLQGMTVSGLRVYAPADIPELVSSQDIDRVVLAMPSLSHPKQAQIAQRLANVGCEVQRIPSFAQLIGDKDMVESLEPVHPADFLGRRALTRDMPGFSESYTGKSVMVTGAGGSIGSELCRQLLICQPSRIVLLEQNEAALYTIAMELGSAREAKATEIKSVLGSISDLNLVRATMEEFGINIVLHAAAHKHVPLVQANALEGLRNNVLGTRTLAEAAMSAGVDRFILISSDKAVRPSSLMGASKRMAELVLQDIASRCEKTIFSTVRFGNVLGSSGSVIPLFQEQITRGGPVTLTHRDITRYFMTCPEAVHLVLLAGSYSMGGDVFVLDMGKPVRIRDLAQQMIERSGYTVRDANNPEGDIEIVVTGLRPGEKLYEELLIGTNMQATPHPKILRAREDSLSEIEIANMLRDIDRAINERDAAGVAMMAERWVAGYRSYNSAEEERLRKP